MLLLYYQDNESIKLYSYLQFSFTKNQIFLIFSKTLKKFQYNNIIYEL